MTLTPRDIQEKQFNDAFRGYNHEEVDLFLDEVAEAFTAVYRESQTMHQKVRDLEEQLTKALATEDMLKRTLIAAQRTAEEAVEEARAKAREMVAAGERRADGLVVDGERRAQEIVAAAQAREREIQVNIEGLKRFEQELKRRLQVFLESQLKVIAEGSEPATPSAGPPAARPPQAAAAPGPGHPGTAAPPRDSARGFSSPDAPLPAARPGGPQTASAPGFPGGSDLAGVPAAASPPRAEPPRPPGQPHGSEKEPDEGGRGKASGDLSIKELFWGDE